MSGYDLLSKAMNLSQLIHSHEEVPPGILPWLNCDEAITPQLKKLTGDARLDILQQRWQLADWWMQTVLGLGRDAKTFQRDILMWSANTACWFARTIIPQSCYGLEPGFFQRLQTESMAALLYNEPRVERQARNHYLIDQRCLEYYFIPASIRPDDPLWMRVSEYRFKSRASLFLLEIFLPGCPAWQ